LTAARSRTVVLLAKLLVVLGFAAFFSLLVGTLAPLLTWSAFHLRGVSLGHQDLHYMDLAWRAVFTGCGFSLAGFVFAVLIRHQVGAIAATLLFPGMIEQLLSLLLKNNAVHLPFRSLMQIMDGKGLNPSPVRDFLICAGISLVLCWFLFRRRDAN
jgi:hypothetical protein